MEAEKAELVPYLKDMNSGEIVACLFLMPNSYGVWVEDLQGISFHWLRNKMDCLRKVDASS